MVDKPKVELEEDVISLITKAMATVTSDIETKKGKRKIALLVRTNLEAEMIDKWCKKQKDIQTYLNIGGTFFTSDAVKHFSILIEALLFPRRISSIVNLINSPYSSKGVYWISFAAFNGNEPEIYKFLEVNFLLKDLTRRSFEVMIKIETIGTVLEVAIVIQELFNHMEIIVTGEGEDEVSESVIRTLKEFKVAYLEEKREEGQYIKVYD
ncbi:hypothetical protein [Bacillus sp. 7884-1]|uniref:hypothetical protein n=1 Tax=Bacillus sp. 7884-1 TaxID=2021693 RepID=UPI000BA63594|nr:hypothetical protein [Bacillus sp. 7884-1]PAE37515.1 hypothetical protein CHI06_20135 [Bacillus sp. 7884-1]